MAYVHWTTASETDMEGIYAYIAFQHGRRSTAKKILRDLRQQCDEYAALFAAGSVLGTARDDLGESFRLFSHKRWLVVFRPIENGIEVLRVVDGSRDYGQLFGH
jgi:toxin ParE1/3/4